MSWIKGLGITSMKRVNSFIVVGYPSVTSHGLRKSLCVKTRQLPVCLATRGGNRHHPVHTHEHQILWETSTDAKWLKENTPFSSFNSPSYYHKGQNQSKFWYTSQGLAIAFKSQTLSNLTCSTYIYRSKWVDHFWLVKALSAIVQGGQNYNKKQ